LHRAAVRDHIDGQHDRCPICNGSGIEFISIWDWTTGCAVTVSQMPCQCTKDTDPELDPPAPNPGHELGDAQSTICRFDAELEPLNWTIKYDDGRLMANDWAWRSRLVAMRKIAT